MQYVVMLTTTTTTKQGVATNLTNVVMSIDEYSTWEIEIKTMNSKHLTQETFLTSKLLLLPHLFVRKTHDK